MLLTLLCLQVGLISAWVIWHEFVIHSGQSKGGKDNGIHS